MSEPERPTSETANGFTARGEPLWKRQATGAVVAAVVAATVASADFDYVSLRDVVASAVGWLLVAAVIRFYIAVGWRVVDEVDVDFKTRALRFGQRRVRGRRQRTVEAYDLATVREVSFGSYQGHPLDWFVFGLKHGEKIRFRCPPGVLSATRGSLQRAGHLNAEAGKGGPSPPTAVAGVAVPPR
jgi:hypothetical protein